MHEDQSLRETDRWLRRWALIAPIITFVVGTMWGFCAGVWIYHDLNGRVIKLEGWHAQHDEADKEVDKAIDARIHIIEDRQDQIRTVVEDKLKVHIQ